MIKKLSLKNFKTHKDTELEFSSGVNIITGDSGNGKTNILLALNWAVNNRPRGKGVIRRGQGGSTVVMEIIDNNETCGIIRKRNESENIYDIKKDGVSIDPINAGSTPPETVSEILNLSDINVQKQRDQHFLVYTPPGQIATYIRSITKLDEIDKARKSLSSKILSEKGEITHCQEELKSTDAKLATLSRIDLALFESRIVEARNRILKIKQTREKIERISLTVEALRTLEKSRIVIPDNVDQIFDNVEKYSESIPRLSEHISRLSILIAKIKQIEKYKITLPDNVNQVFDNVEKYSESIPKLSERISGLEILIVKIKQIEKYKITLPENLEILSAGENISEKYDNVYERIETLLGMIEEIRTIESKVDISEKQLEQLKCEEKQLEEKLDICPSCGTELTKESKEVLLKAKE